MFLLLPSLKNDKGTSFARIEDDTLKEAIAVLRPDENLLPSRISLAGRLLDKTFNKVKSICESYLSDKTLYFCLATDGWTNVLNDAIINYIAVSPQKTIFLESVTTQEQGHTAEFIATDIERVFQAFPNTNFCGAIMDNTSANRNAWGRLKSKFPEMFFQGCMSHGLHLLVKDIFAPTKSKRNGDISGQATYPDGYPFEYLLNFANDCKELVKFFYNHHVVKAALSEAQKAAGITQLIRPAPTRYLAGFYRICSHAPVGGAPCKAASNQFSIPKT